MVWGKSTSPIRATYVTWIWTLTVAVFTQQKYWVLRLLSQTCYLECRHYENHKSQRFELSDLRGSMDHKKDAKCEQTHAAKPSHLNSRLNVCSSCEQGLKNSVLVVALKVYKIAITDLCISWHSNFENIWEKTSRSTVDLCKTLTRCMMLIGYLQCELSGYWFCFLLFHRRMHCTYYIPVKHNSKHSDNIGRHSAYKPPAFIFVFYVNNNNNIIIRAYIAQFQNWSLRCNFAAGKSSQSDHFTPLVLPNTAHIESALSLWYLQIIITL